jgi:hypothetical protein
MEGRKNNKVLYFLGALSIVLVLIIVAVVYRRNHKNESNNLDDSIEKTDSAFDGSDYEDLNESDFEYDKNSSDSDNIDTTISNMDKVLSGLNAENDFKVDDEIKWD